jgi:preprotein translocase subunit SecY
LLQNSTFHIPLISARRLNRVPVQVWYGDDPEEVAIYTRNYIPFRMNQGGVMPVILTTSFLAVPNYLVNLKIFSWLNAIDNDSLWVRGFYWISYITLIFVSSSFYSSIILNPKYISDDLQKATFKIPGIRPGIQTTYFLKKELRRIALFSAALLAFITVVPNFLESTFNITSFKGLSTTSILILGGVMLDLKGEISDIYFSEVYGTRYK